MTPEELQTVKKLFQSKKTLQKNKTCDICETLIPINEVKAVKGSYGTYCIKCIEKFGLIKVEDYD